MDRRPDRSLEQIPRAIAVRASGPTWFHEELVTPFLREAADPLTEEGFAWLGDAAGEFEVPQGLFETEEHETGPVAMIGGIPEAIAVAIFLGTSVGSWAVGRICDAIWDGRIRPALRQLSERRQEDTDLARRSIVVRIGAWFDTDGVFVEVIAELRPGETLETVEELVPEAFRRAFTWV